MTSRVRYSSIPRDHERNSFCRLEPATSSLRTQPTYFSVENTQTLPNPGRSTRLDKFCKSSSNTVARRLSSQPPEVHSGSRYHYPGIPDRIPHSASMNSTKSSSLPMHCATDAGGGTTILSPADVSADELASQLTLLDLPIFQAIEPEELLSCSWNKKNKMEIAPNIVASTRRFNHVSFWTIQEILKFPDPRSRADIMAHFIKLARRLHDLNNLHSEFAILSALQSAAIYRLNKTWAMLSKSSKQTFDKLKEMFSDKDNWGKLRDHINSTALKHSPCIPYLGLFLTDLMMVDIAHPSTGGLESQQRQNKMNNILRIVSELQQSTYSNLTTLPTVQTYLASVRYIDELQKFIEDDQFKISLRLEPNANSPPISSANSKESLRHHSTEPQPQSRDLPIHLSPICLSPSRRSGGCIPKKSSFVPSHRKSRSEGGSTLFGCGGAGLASPDMPQHQFNILSNGKSVMKVNSMDSLENEKQRSLLDGSLLDDPLPMCNTTPSPIYSPFHEKEALTSPDPLASFSTVQPGSVRTFQGSIQRKTLIKDGRRPLVASWQKFWLELWDTSLVYYLPKTLSKCRDRRDFKSEPCKLRSTVGWIVMVPQQTNQLQPADQHSFQLADPVMRNVYRFRGEKKDRDLWVYHLTRATRGLTNQSLPTNLISFE